MIFLFGSYGHNNYLVYDEKYEFSKIQFNVSDYDILVVTSHKSQFVEGKEETPAIDSTIETIT